MAYKKEELERTALEAIKKHKLVFIEDIIAYLPCSSSTFYNHELEKLESIKEALQEVRITIKVSMRSKWYKSSAPALQMGLMKLIGSEEERKRLTQSYTDLTTGGDKIGAEDLSGLNDQELKAYLAIKNKLQSGKYKQSE